MNIQVDINNPKNTYCPNCKKVHEQEEGHYWVAAITRTEDGCFESCIKLKGEEAKFVYRPTTSARYLAEDCDTLLEIEPVVFVGKPMRKEMEIEHREECVDYSECSCAFLQGFLEGLNRPRPEVVQSFKKNKPMCIPQRCVTVSMKPYKKDNK